MPARSLHIAWLGPAPGKDGGVAAVGTDLLHGLAELGHRIDCFFPSSGQELPPHLAADANITFVWGTSQWQWQRWYSKSRISAFASGIVSRSIASVRLRAEIQRRHTRDPYDLIYQFSSLESLAVPPHMARTVPLVIHPETHSAGELKSLLAERRLALRCQPWYRFAIVATIMLLRTLVQRKRIRAASLLVCISSVFRDHLVSDYGFPVESTVVVPNPVRVKRFAKTGRQPGEPALVLVLGRVVARKGVESVVAVARRLAERDVPVRMRIVGGPSLWSDYTKLLDDLPTDSAEYVGPVAAEEIPAELAGSDLLLQASTYEPFALTVAEALAAGVPVVATNEVGAIEGVARSVVAEVSPGDVPAMTDAILAMLERLRADPAKLRATARQEASRLFSPEVVCEQISTSLQRLVEKS